MGLGLGSEPCCPHCPHGNRSATLFPVHNQGVRLRNDRFGGKLRRLRYIRCKQLSEGNKEELATDIESLDHFASRPWLAASRFGEVVVAFTRLAVSHGLPVADFNNINKQALGHELCTVLTCLGPTFIKLGQTLATRPDVMGEDIARELEQLQTGAPPFSNQAALEMIEEELKQPVDQVFSFLSEDPIASASLGQVYFGVLAASGTEVAVKVQRPKMLSSITLDIYVLRSVLGLVRSLASINQDIRLVADEVGQGLLGELDYQGEAQRSQEFKSAHMHLGFVQVPDVIASLTTKRVLTTTWVDGLSPTDYLAYMDGLFPRQNMYYRSTVLAAAESLESTEAEDQLLNVVQLGVECSLSQLLQTGVMHADPHPGNIMRALDGSIVYLDFGLLTYVPKSSSQAMMSALVHIVLANYPAAVEDMDDMGLLKPTTDRQALAGDLECELTRMMGQEPKVNGALSHKSPLKMLLESKQTEMSFGSLSKLMLKLAVKHRFRLPPYYILIVRSLATLEGVALKADPHFKIVKAAFPIVLRQLLYDSRPAAIALLRELLLDESCAIRLDWLGDLLDLYKARKIIQVAAFPHEELPLEPVIKEPSKLVDGQESHNGAAPQQLDQGEASISQFSIVQNSDIGKENNNIFGSNGHSMNGTRTTLGSEDTIGRNGSNDFSSTSTDSAENVTSTKSTASLPPQQHRKNRKLSGRGRTKRLDILDMMLSRQSHGLRRVLIECDVVKLLDTLNGPEGKKWRLLLASSLRAAVLGGLKSVLHFPLKALLKLWMLVTRHKESKDMKQILSSRIRKRRLRLLVRAQLQKVCEAGLFAYLALVTLFMRVLWVAVFTPTRRSTVFSSPSNS